MFETLWEQIQALLGLGRDVADVGTIQMALRTVVIYALTLVIIRLGSKRFLSDATAFDVIVGIMLGSIMSRAINGSAPLLPTVAAGLVLIGIHWLLGTLAYHLDWFGSAIKGNPIVLIKEGTIQEDGVRRAGLSRYDLEQALRLNSQQEDPSKVKHARLERNGRVSIIPREQEPRVLEISVAEGVQTVRIELE